MSFWSLALIVVGLFSQLAYFGLVSEARSRTSLLKLRLEAYCKMKDGDSGDCSGESVEGLSCGQHKILLGILKKVEAKNASLFRAWTFVAAAIIAMYAAFGDAQLSEYLAASLVLCVPFLWASLRGMRQIDQLDMPKDIASPEKLRTQMQRELMQDLLCKEQAFDFAYRGAFIFLSIGILIASAYIFSLEN